jgi:hypothetical protein
MFKTCYCALAMAIGALIGATAPVEWRADADRVARTAAVMDSATHSDLAMVYRPFQRDN